MKTVLIIILTFITFNLSADCLSCWELYNVEITLKNGEVVKGYITWNDSWINNETRKLSILEKVQYQLENTSWYELTLYHEIINLGNHLPCANGIVSTNKIDTLELNDFKNIEAIPTKEKRYVGAGWIQNLDDESIKLLKREPVNFIREEGIVSESFYLNYNPEISLEDLKKIANDKDFWYKRKSFEKNQIIGLMYSWD